MSAEETLTLISRQWCSLEDLMKLADVGRNTALNIILFELYLKLN